MTKTNDILSTESVNDKDLNEKEIEDIEEEYYFEDIKNTLDKGNTPQLLKFSFGFDNENIIIACNLLSLKEDNNKFISFLCLDHGQNILAENSLLIHTETGNIFYGNFNTNKSFCHF